MSDGSIPGTTADASDKGGSQAFSLVANEVSIRVNPTDDPPVVAHPLGNMVVDKDEVRKTVNLSSVFTDPDNDPAEIIKSLEYNNNPYLVTATVKGNTLTMEFSDHLLGKADITLRGESNGKEVSDTFTVTVTEEILPPVTSDPLPPSLSPIGEDSFDNNGNTVDEIFGENFLSEVDFFTDASGNPIKAIVVTALNNRIGKWQYSTNDGTDWNDFAETEGGFAYIESEARLLDSAHRIRFVPRKDYYGKATLTFRAWDKRVGYPGGTLDTGTESRSDEAGFSSVADEVSISVVPVDDPPTVENPIEDIVLDEEEDVSEGIIMSLSSVFGDIDNDPFLITKSLESNTHPSLVSAEVDRNTLTLNFNEGQRGQTAITIKGDSNGQTVTDTFVVRKGMPNIAPVLDPDLSPTLTPIEPDDFMNPGDTVADILAAASITDEDGPGAALAVIAVDNSHGIWQYSLDDGETWRNFSIVTGGTDDIEAQAVLLDETHWIRFMPNPGFVGTSTFTFRAWDKSSAKAGDTADASINGDDTAYSAATATARIRVSACLGDNILLGDADANGIIDIGDVILILKVLTGIQVTDICIYADVDDDGTIGMAEFVHVLKELSE